MLETVVEEQIPGICIGKLDVEKFPEIAQLYDVDTLPDTRVFRGGHSVAGFQGVRDEVFIQALARKELAALASALEAESLEPTSQASGGSAPQLPAIQPIKGRAPLPDGIEAVPTP